MPTRASTLIARHAFRPNLRNKRCNEAEARNPSNPFASVNPFDPFAQLRQDQLTLHDLGMTRIGNQAVHHDAATERVQQARPEFFTGHPQTVTKTFDIYVDSHNRFVRLRAATKQPGDESTNTNEIDFSGYGTRVNVAPPPANEVAPATDVPPTPENGTWHRGPAQTARSAFVVHGAYGIRCGLFVERLLAQEREDGSEGKRR